MIKRYNCFFVSGENGEISSEKIEGLFLKDTRYISKYKVLWNGLLVGGNTEEKDNTEIVSYSITCPRISVKIERYIENNCLYENLYFSNEGNEEASGILSIKHEEDFKDIFILRKFRFGEIGSITGSKLSENEFSITYSGKDNIERKLSYEGEGQVKDENTIEYNITLDKGEKKTFTQAWSALHGNGAEEIVKKLRSFKENRKVYSEVMKNLLFQSLKDIERLKSSINGKVFVAAGIPVYGTIFGRDSIITGLQLININSSVLRDTLEILGRYQGKEVNPFTEEEPGKIFHELREGELSNTKQVPFYPYYGSIDSTELFLIGIAEYYKITKDREFLNSMLGCAVNALAWIDKYGDKDGDGFVEYIQMSKKGIRNQGWKDSQDSVVHKNGELASGSIALCEVQGYVYKAKLQWSDIFLELGRYEEAEKLKCEAEILKKKFNAAFWMDDYFALALDGNKNRVEVVTSNPLHCLYCGIIDEEKIPLVVERAFRNDLFTDYGIRTMSSLEKPYDPLSYHNGSIWPHDNSIIALGLKKYGYDRELAFLANAIFKAGNSMKNLQIPELYGGEELKLYESACVPQAWAAGAVILLNELLVN